MSINCADATKKKIKKKYFRIYMCIVIDIRIHVITYRRVWDIL